MMKHEFKAIAKREVTDERSVISGGFLERIALYAFACLRLRFLTYLLEEISCAICITYFPTIPKVCVHIMCATVIKKQKSWQK